MSPLAAHGPLRRGQLRDHLVDGGLGDRAQLVVRPILNRMWNEHARRVEAQRTGLGRRRRYEFC